MDLFHRREWKFLLKTSQQHLHHLTPLRNHFLMLKIKLIFSIRFILVKPEEVLKQDSKSIEPPPIIINTPLIMRTISLPPHRLHDTCILHLSKKRKKLDILKAKEIYKHVRNPAIKVLNIQTQMWAFQSNSRTKTI